MLINTSHTFHATTIIGIQRDGKTIIAGDGQVSLGATIMKNNAKKIRRLNENVIAGFAGATADAFTLFEKLETKLEQYPKNLTRACVELAKDWRQDKFLRKLEAMMIVADQKNLLLLSGTGDIIEPETYTNEKGESRILAIGSGGMYALCAGKALLQYSACSIEEIAKNALNLAADVCIYTNHNIIMETL